MTMLDEIYKAMADGHRRQIVSALTQAPMFAGELAVLVQLAPNALSFHLKWLKSAGLVSIQREGRFLRYHANPQVLADWQSHVRLTFDASAAPGQGSPSRAIPKAYPRFPRTPRAVLVESLITSESPTPVELYSPIPPDESLPTELL